MRVPEYRFTRYFKEGKWLYKLYTYAKDRYERVNIADENKTVVKEFTPIVEKGHTINMSKIKLPK